MHTETLTLRGRPKQYPFASQNTPSLHMATSDDMKLQSLAYLPGFSPGDRVNCHEVDIQKISHTARMLEMPPPWRDAVIDIGGVKAKWGFQQE